MRKFIFYITIFLSACSSQNDVELMNRALNNEAMQALNIQFEEKNMDYYSDVEKMNASLRATKGELLNLDNYNKLDSMFSFCKYALDSIQNELFCRDALPVFSRQHIYKTSEIKNLEEVIEFDITKSKQPIMTTCNSIKELLGNDTIIHMFSELDPSEYVDDKINSYARYLAEVDSVIHQFDSSFTNVGNRLRLIDVLEFFTLARATLLVVERQSIRFHNLIALTRPKLIRGEEINVVVKTNKEIYKPGEKMIIQPHLIILNPANHRKLIYTGDSLNFVSTLFSVKPKLDTIYLNTAVAGNHFVSVEYISGAKYARVFRKTYYYTVLPK